MFSLADVVIALPLAQRKMSETAARNRFQRFQRIGHALCRSQLEHNCSAVAVATAERRAHGFQRAVFSLADVVIALPLAQLKSARHLSEADFGG